RQVAASKTAPTGGAAFNPAFQQDVKGSGPTGAYNINNEFYATADTAKYLAEQFGGTVQSVNTTADWQRFSYPQQLFIVFPDGSTINAGYFATYLNTDPAA